MTSPSKDRAESNLAWAGEIIERFAKVHRWKSAGEMDIAVALEVAHQRGFAEGMKRAAEIARAAGDTWSGTRDAMVCAQEAAVDAKCEEIAKSILVEIGGR